VRAAGTILRRRRVWRRFADACRRFPWASAPANSRIEEPDEGRWGTHVSVSLYTPAPKSRKATVGAGLLTSGSTDPAGLPNLLPIVRPSIGWTSIEASGTDLQFVPSYSDGLVPDSHRLPAVSRSMTTQLARADSRISRSLDVTISIPKITTRETAYGSRDGPRLVGHPQAHWSWARWPSHPRPASSRRAAVGLSLRVL
jgi:hypothetical protein